MTLPGYDDDSSKLKCLGHKQMIRSLVTFHYHSHNSQGSSFEVFRQGKFMYKTIQSALQNHLEASQRGAEELLKSKFKTNV